MRPNIAKDRFMSGQPSVNAWLSLPSAYAAEVVASQGFQAVTVDMQHGMIGFDAAVGMLQAIGSTAATPLVRVRSSEPTLAMQMLDAGAYGVICPQVDTPEIARRFVAACRYPPLGNRSFGPARGLLYGGAGYETEANSHVLTLGQIESVQALANLDAILATPGLDGIYIGPNDLALSMGCKPGSDFEGPVAEAVQKILDATRRAGLLAGIWCASGEKAARRLRQGFHMATPGNDANALATASKARLEEALAGAAPPTNPSPRTERHGY